eukprot:1177406-Prorocentrum_minimum.AAC.3
MVSSERFGIAGAASPTLRAFWLLGVCRGIGEAPAGTAVGNVSLTESLLPVCLLVSPSSPGFIVPRGLALKLGEAILKDVLLLLGDREDREDLLPLGVASPAGE